MVDTTVSMLTLERIVRLRAIPNMGLYLTLTQRCPMSCSHCSTNSSMRSPHVPNPGLLESFVESMTPSQHPEIVLFTGGEPFLLPSLVASLARKAKAIGCQVQAITGG